MRQSRLFIMLGSFVALSFASYLGSSEVMTSGRNVVLFGILILGLIFLFRLCCIHLNKGSRFLLYLFLSVSIYIYLYLVRVHLVSWLGLCLSGILSNFFILTFSNSGIGVPNPEPEANAILSYFGNQDPDLELELYARIRLLESHLVDRLPPQLNHGEYESLCREHLNQALTIEDYQAFLNNEIFEIEILELKDNLQDRLFTLFLNEPDARLTQLLRESPFSECKIREEALCFIEERVSVIHLERARSPFQKALFKTTLSTWLNDLQEHGTNYVLYKDFITHFRGEG